MGRLVLQNIGISVDMLQLILQGYEEELKSDNIDIQRRRLITLCGCAFVNLFGGALRGGDVLRMERTEFASKIEYGKSHPTNPHMLIPLMGRLKGESGERKLLMPLANVTNSGINIRIWNERLSDVLTKEDENKTIGLAFCSKDGSVIRSWELNGELMAALSRVQIQKSSAHIGHSDEVLLLGPK